MKLRILMASVLFLASLEFVAVAIFFLWRSEVFYSRPELAAEGSAAGEGAALLQIDPYRGFSRPPGLTAGDIWLWHASSVGLARPTPPPWFDVESNNLGFFSEFDYPVNDPDAFFIGIFGGSVAQWWYLESERQLVEAFEVAGSRPVLLNLAQSAYKQPQQLLTLVQLLMLGQRFDLIINLDGFNEAYLGSSNREAGVDESMPAVSQMLQLHAGSPSGADQEALEWIAKRAETRAKILQGRRTSLTTRSAARYFFQQAALRFHRARLTALQSSPPPSQTGVPGLASSMPIAEERVAADWARSSRLMAQLAEANGIPYLHVLQPSQYFGRRVFSAAEEAVARDLSHPFAEWVPREYPRLQAQGDQLTADGVAFLDATTVFDKIEDQVYIDTCCHLTAEGHRVLTELVVGHSLQLVAEASGRLRRTSIQAEDERAQAEIR